MRRYLGTVSHAGQAQLGRGSYCRSPDEMSSSVSFGLNSDTRSAIFLQSSRLVIAVCRFSWYTELVGFGDDSSSFRWVLAEAKRVRIFVSGSILFVIIGTLSNTVQLCVGGRNVKGREPCLRHTVGAARGNKGAFCFASSIIASLYIRVMTIELHF